MGLWASKAPNFFRILTNIDPPKNLFLIEFHPLPKYICNLSFIFAHFLFKIHIFLKYLAYKGTRGLSPPPLVRHLWGKFRVFVEFLKCFNILFQVHLENDNLLIISEILVPIAFSRRVENVM